MNMYNDNLSDETVMFLSTMHMTFSAKSNVSFLHHIKFLEQTEHFVRKYHWKNFTMFRYANIKILM